MSPAAATDTLPVPPVVWAVAWFDGPDSPLSSKAVTVYEYVVPGFRPVSAYAVGSVACTVAIGVPPPLRYTW